ncbi:MAG: GH3 auxin-responsive promoter family protein, partial [Saprospiraceae bacterium]|nr:GH3 auxin-responsive promoter family protein [Saprospiraceae bacterium]
ISTNGGLWRYMPGDTVRFTSLAPYRLQITGRTKHHINAFGEELMVADADLALANTCRKLDVKISDYSAAPRCLGQGVGLHEWAVEFMVAPPDMNAFAKELDKQLQDVNSDYAAKRIGDLALKPLIAHHLPPGSFQRWLKSRGKQGAQIKVPRLSNDRTTLREILEQQANTSQPTGQRING